MSLAVSCVNEIAVAFFIIDIDFSDHCAVTGLKVICKFKGTVPKSRYEGWISHRYGTSGDHLGIGLGSAKNRSQRVEYAVHVGVTPEDDRRTNCETTGSQPQLVAPSGNVFAEFHLKVYEQAGRVIVARVAGNGDGRDGRHLIHPMFRTFSEKVYWQMPLQKRAFGLSFEGAFAIHKKGKRLPYSQPGWPQQYHSGALAAFRQSGLKTILPHLHVRQMVGDPALVKVSLRMGVGKLGGLKG